MPSQPTAGAISGDTKPQRRRRFQMPHIYVLLVSFSAIAAIATHLVPASIYQRVEGPNGRMVVDPSTYQIVDSTPVDLMGWITSVPRGLIAASDVVFFTFIIGGMFMVLRRSGIIQIGLGALSRRLSHRSIVMVPVLMVVFASIATLIATQELSLVYIPVILPLLLSLGYDAVVAAATALVATTAGYTAGILSPINTGLAQQISDLPLFSGAPVRAVVFALLVGTGIFWVMRYAQRAKKDPEKYSLMFGDADQELRRKEAVSGMSDSPIVVTPRLRIALFLLIPFVALLVWGVMTQGWFFIEMSGIFITLAVVVGWVAGLSLTEIAKGFDAGMREVLAGAIICGVARSVAVVLEDGQILDTIVHALGTAVGALPEAVTAVGMLVAQSLFNLVVPSGSGQALVTMPIMAPLADLVGVTRQVGVLAFQLGDGPSNILYPTSGYFMAALALAGVSWKKWIRFFLPLLGIWFVIATVLLVVLQFMDWTG